MSRVDRRGLPISTTSDLAAAHYQHGIDLLLSAWPGADQVLQQAIAADPDFALAHAARARLYAIRAEPALAKASIESAQAALERNGTEREQSHVTVLARVINGQPDEALSEALAHIDAWPRDVVILSLPLGAFGLFAFSGMADHDQARVDLVERHARHFEADDWWFVCSRGWAHAENGNVAYGRALTERGLELHGDNANGAHALLHAMHEGGAHAEAERLVADWLPGYDSAGILHGHIAWHGALAALDRGDGERALELYTCHVQPSVSAGMPINVISDSAALLWRLQAYGHSVPPELWENAASYAAGRFQAAGFAFIDVHMALLAAAVGDRAAVAEREQALSALVAAGELRAGPVVPAICRAALAFAEADYDGCARLLEPVAAEVVRIGGSGAQREIIEDMRLLALMHSGDTLRAHALLNHRLHRRPSRRDRRWQHQLELAVAAD